jgi:hypothetical protein
VSGGHLLPLKSGLWDLHQKPRGPFKRQKSSIIPELVMVCSILYNNIQGNSEDEEYVWVCEWDALKHPQTVHKRKR